MKKKMIQGMKKGKQYQLMPNTIFEVFKTIVCVCVRACSTFRSPVIELIHFVSLGDVEPSL